ncbi:hypothetical protein FRC12_010932 [Ceratobasidium sp. 428]|nr:hypothetical protein FRC12_010932 [Ceratobasidium sp. 428]
MVQINLTTALIAFAAAVGVSAAPRAGTYSITQGSRFLSLDSKDATAVIAFREDVKDLAAKEWILEPGCGKGTVALRNNKYGTYLGYQTAQSGANVSGSPKRRNFKLVPSADNKAYYITTTELVNGAPLFVDEGLDNKMDSPNVLLGTKEFYTQPWTFKLESSSKPSGSPKPNGAPKPNTKPTEGGKSSRPKWIWE